MSFFLFQTSPHRTTEAPHSLRDKDQGNLHRSKTLHLSHKLGSLLSSRILVLFFSSTSPLLRTSCMLFAHPGILSPLTFLHVYSSSLPPSLASPSLYLRALSQHPIISLWKQLSHFNLFVQYLILHQAARFMVLFVLFTVATPVLSRGSGTCLVLKYMKETKHEAVRFYLYKKYV